MLFWQPPDRCANRRITSQTSVCRRSQELNRPHSLCRWLVRMSMGTVPFVSLAVAVSTHSTMPTMTVWCQRKWAYDFHVDRCCLRVPVQTWFFLFILLYFQVLIICFFPVGWLVGWLVYVFRRERHRKLQAMRIHINFRLDGRWRQDECQIEWDKRKHKAYKW